MDRLTKLEVFSKIAETGSFFETARSLNLSRPTVTRLMAELEKDLNQKLLFRNTRRVSLTSAGESFLPRARELLNLASDIFHSPRHSEKYDGLYRINIATTYANFKLPELIEEFQKLHPGIRIELLLSASPLPLVQNRIDLRFQIGGKVNPLYIKRSLGKSNSWMCASPAYLDTHSRPETIKDLLKQDLLHNLVIDEDLGEELLHVKGRGVYTWWFTHGNKREKLKVAPKFACNYSKPLYHACLRGQGIAYLPISESLLDVLEGRLEVVLPEYRGILVDIWAVYASSAHKPPFTEELLAYVRHAFETILANPVEQRAEAV